MDERRCDAIVIHCFDYRLQKMLDDWLEATLGTGNYDRVALAGGVLDINAIFSQVELAHRLHHVERVVLINHEDCMAYGPDGTLARHRSDLVEAARRIVAQIPDVAVDLYYLRLNGVFERVQRPSV